MKIITNKRETIRVELTDDQWNNYLIKAEKAMKNKSQTTEQKARELVLTYAMQVAEHREYKKEHENFVPIIDRDEIISSMEHNHLVNFLMDELTNAGYKLNDIMRLWNNSHVPTSLKSRAAKFTKEWMELRSHCKDLFSEEEIEKEIEETKKELIHSNNFHFRYADSEMNVYKI